MKGIQLITLYYTDLSGKSVPVNYRIYNKQDGQTKNDYLREMITEVLAWGVKPHTVTTDAWYSCKKNLKFLKNKELEFLTGIAKNRLCSVDGKNFTQVQNLEIPEAGLVVYLKKFGQVKVFRRSSKNETPRYYIIRTYALYKLTIVCINGQWLFQTCRGARHCAPTMVGKTLICGKIKRWRLLIPTPYLMISVNA